MDSHFQYDELQPLDKDLGSMPCPTPPPEYTAMLQAMDPDLLHNFNNADFADLYRGMWDPSATPNPTEEGPSFIDLEPQELENAVAALQKQMDVLIKLKAQKDAKHEAEGVPDLNDPTEQLLAYGLRALLKKVLQVLGSERLPDVMVSFTGLSFRAHMHEATNAIATNGNQLLKLLMPWRHGRTLERYVLRDVTGSFRPGVTTVVLGPPGAGKSTLMKALSGRLHQTRHAKLEGTVEYGGQPLQDKALRRQRNSLKLYKMVGYVPQHDLHIPTLTVRETIRFAHACTSLPTEELMREVGLDEQGCKEMLLILRDMLGELAMSILGIRHVGDTIVGNEHLRGISGGQRKRLTTGEIVVTGTPVLFMDEISTGLDSATTFDICRSLNDFAHDLRNTVVVSLLQPTPETYNIFDEVLVMTAGQIAFHGSRDQVMPYFQSLGFACPHGKDTAEFVTEVTQAQGILKYRADMEHGTPWFAIREPEDFGEAWRNSDLFRQRLEEDIKWYQRSKDSLDAVPERGYTRHFFTSRYSNPLLRTMWLCLRRQVVLTMRNKGVTYGNLIGVVVIGLVLGSLFFQTAFTSYSSFYSVLFFSMVFIALSCFANIPAIIEERNVIYRQTTAHFYGSMPYSFATSLLDIPIAFLEVILFASVAYFMIGLAPGVTNFFQFVLTIALVRLAMGAFIRFIAVISPNAEIAFASCAGALLILILMAGFFAAKDDIKPWWIWSYWINPLQYGMTSLIQIQFYSDQYNTLISPFFPSLGTWGYYFLNLKKMPLDPSRTWLGYIYNACFFLLMTVANGLALRFLQFSEEHVSHPRPAQRPVEHDQGGDKALPFVPCTLAWQDLCYDVNIPGKRGRSAKLGLRLLSHVSGYAKPGTLTAVMGFSGTGKTTLLDVLAGRKTTGKVTGQILLNGQAVNPLTMSHYCGYVEQMDIHTHTATVLEAVMFSALLRLPREVPRVEKESFVWKVLQQLDLVPIANRKIGNRQTGLSVEQVKRLTIAVEMVANPSVLFVDEPTSGLDSFAADVVMGELKALTDTGRTIICTIHQPSGYLFSMFHHLLLLVQGGKTVFFGETGEDSQALIAYFNAIPGSVLRYDGRQNPATWMLSVVSVEGIDFPAQYEGSNLWADKARRLQEAMQVTGEHLTTGHRYQATWLEQFRLLFQKWWRTYWRFPEYNLGRTYTSIFIALMMGSMFFQQQLGDVQGAFTLVGLQFIPLLFMGVMFADTVQGLVAMERPVYYRERASHMYHPVLLDVVVGLCELPYITLNCLIFAPIFYWMVGMGGSVTLFFIWVLIFWLFVVFYTYFGFWMGLLMPNSQGAAAMVSVFASVSAMMSGFMLGRNDIPWWWRWLHYGIPETYTLQALLSSQYYCEAADVNPLAPGDCPTFLVTLPTSETIAVSMWQFALSTYYLAYNDRWWYLALVAMFIVLVRIFTVLTLMFVNHAKR